MSEVFWAGPRFVDWDGKSKVQLEREMARRKAMRLRLAKKFKQYPSWQDKYHVYFWDAPLEFEKELKAYLKGVMDPGVVRVWRPDIIPPEVRRRMKKTAPRKPEKPVNAKPPVMSESAVRAFLRGRGSSDRSGQRSDLCSGTGFRGRPV